MWRICTEKGTSAALNLYAPNCYPYRQPLGCLSCPVIRKKVGFVHLVQVGHLAKALRSRRFALAPSWILGLSIPEDRIKLDENFPPSLRPAPWAGWSSALLEGHLEGSTTVRYQERHPVVIVYRNGPAGTRCRILLPGQLQTSELLNLAMQ